MRIGINSFQTPVCVDILAYTHESQMFLVASRMVNPFKKVFNVLFQINQMNIYLRQLCPYEMYFLNNRT